MKLVLKITIILLIINQKNYFQNLPEQLQNKLESLQESYSVYGLTAAVMVGDEIIWSGTAGYSNPQTKDTITTDMTSSIGSITKIFTSAIILQMVEEGKLSLDQTIDNWFESSQKINGNATIRQLLNHTSGIGNFTTDAWVDSFKINPDRIWNTQDLIDTFVSQPDFEPGTDWKYSNTGYLLLGEIIEEIEGKSYHEVLNERILDPLELNNMYTPIYDEPTNPQITPWFDLNDDGERDNLFNHGLIAMHTSAWAAGYIYSNPTDLVKFGRSLFSNKIIYPNSLNQMMQFNETGLSFEYGLGLIKYNDYGPDLLGHDGQYIGYTAVLLCQPETEIYVALFSNFTFINIRTLGSELSKIVYNHILTAVEEKELNLIDYHLSQNYPNPFNPATSIEYFVPSNEYVSLKVYDVLGNEIAVLVDEQKSAGKYKVDFNASEISSGIYFYTLRTSMGFSETKKFTLIK